MSSRWRIQSVLSSVSFGRAGGILASLGAAIAALPIVAIAGSFDPPYTFQDGSSINAEDFNESFSAVAVAVNDNNARLSALEEGAVVARCASSAATPLPQNVPNRINFDQCVIDTHDAVSTGADWAFVAPRAGNYRVSARYNTDTLESSFWTAEIHIVVDGEIYSASNLNRSDGGAVLRAHAGIDDIVPLSEGQELYIAAWQNRNANHTLHGDPLFVFVAISEVQ